MIRSFKHKGLEMFHGSGSTRGIRPEHAKRLRIVLGRLEVAVGPSDVDLPGLKLHRLKGKFQGFWSIWISANWRLIFRFHGGDVFDLDYLDYH